MIWVLVLVLLLMAIGGVPSFGLHSYGWGPSGVVTLIVVVLIILVLTGRL